jgi:hypothetical protein
VKKIIFSLALLIVLVGSVFAAEVKTVDKAGFDITIWADSVYQEKGITSEELNDRFIQLLAENVDFMRVDYLDDISTYVSNTSPIAKSFISKYGFVVVQQIMGDTTYVSIVIDNGTNYIYTYMYTKGE